MCLILLNVDPTGPYYIHMVNILVNVPEIMVDYILLIFPNNGEYIYIIYIVIAPNWI